MKKKLPEQQDKKEVKEERKIEPKEISGIPKLTIEVIRKRYLYPFSINSISCLLSMIVTKLKQLGKNIDLVNTKAMQLPLDSLPSNAEQMMAELQKPVTVFIIDT